MDSSKNMEDQQLASGLAKVTPKKLDLANQSGCSLFSATNRSQPMVLQQSRVWPRTIIWSTMSIVALASFACIEEAVFAHSKLQSVSPVRKVQVPTSTVVRAIDVAESNTPSTARQVEQQKIENRLLRQGLLDQISARKNIVLTLKSGIRNSAARLASELSQVDRQLAQIQVRIAAVQKSVRTNKSILNDLRPAAAAGAISPVQIARQEQAVDSSVAELETQVQEKERLKEEKPRLIAANRIEIKGQQQRIQEQQQSIRQLTAEIAQLDKEFAKL